MYGTSILVGAVLFGPVHVGFAVKNESDAACRRSLRKFQDDRARNRLSRIECSLVVGKRHEEFFHLRTEQEAAKLLFTFLLNLRMRSSDCGAPPRKDSLAFLLTFRWVAAFVPVAKMKTTTEEAMTVTPRNTVKSSAITNSRGAIAKQDSRYE